MTLAQMTVAELNTRVVAIAMAWFGLLLGSFATVGNEVQCVANAGPRLDFIDGPVRNFRKLAMWCCCRSSRRLRNLATSEAWKATAHGLLQKVELTGTPGALKQV
jgi:hypothetical protein